MRTDRNDFQKLVDHQMGNIQWSSAKSQAVLHRLQQTDVPRLHQRLPRYTLAFATMAAVLLLIAAVTWHHVPVQDVIVAAQPASTLAPIVKPDTRAEAVFQARAAVMERYGLTLQTLGIFLDDCQLTDSGWAVRFFTTNQINSRLAGEYTVVKQNQSVTASWTHDDVDPALYADGSLNRIAWGHEQLLHAITDGSREAMAINLELNAEDGARIDYSYIEGRELWGDPLSDTTADADDISVDAAAALASKFFEQQFGVSIDTVNETAREAFTIILDGTLYESAAGIRVWVFCPSFEWEGENYYTAIYINARTGALERLEYTTLGNG